MAVAVGPRGRGPLHECRDQLPCAVRACVPRSSPASLEHRLSVSNSTLVVPQDEVQLYQLWAVLTAVTSFRTPVLLNKPPFSSQ